MRFEGSLQSWNDERGFGFIAPDAGGDTVFVHIKVLGPGAARPQIRQRFSFALERSPDGKKRACDVRPLSSAQRLPTQHTANQRTGADRANHPAPRRFWHRPRNPAVLLPIPLLCMLLWFLDTHYTPTRLVATWYAIMSAATFWLYARDKRAAQQGEWRTAENVLLTMGLLLGWPGALLAQQLLRHKSSKTSFLALFWITVAINLAWLIYRFSPLGMHERWAFL